jgi:hypothetical protein
LKKLLLPEECIDINGKALRYWSSVIPIGVILMEFLSYIWRVISSLSRKTMMIGSPANVGLKSKTKTLVSNTILFKFIRSPGHDKHS